MMVSISVQKNTIICFIEDGYGIRYLGSSQKLLVENKINKDYNTAIPLFFSAACSICFVTETHSQRDGLDN